MEIEYEPGDIAPVTSTLYRVVHDPPHDGQGLHTFYSGKPFPRCPDCGTRVRYMLPASVLRRLIELASQ